MGQESLEIRVGADLEAATKAFEKLKGDIDKAMAGGEVSFKRFVSTYQAEIPKIQKKTADASNAVLNFSRVVQDAPYAFNNFGSIANNIDPLFDSFRRLQKETGGFKATLVSLGQSLIGGAGIGLAISTITSLITYFGMQSNEAKKKVVETKKSVDDLAASFAAENVTKIEMFRMALTNLETPLSQRNKILDDYNKIASEQNSLSQKDLVNINAINSALNSQIKLFEQRALVKAAEDQIKDLYKVVFENKFGLQKAIADSGKGTANDIVSGLDPASLSKIPKKPTEAAQAVSGLTGAQRSALPVMKEFGKNLGESFDNLQDFNTALTSSGLTVGQEQDAFGKLGLKAKGFTTNMANAKKQIGDLFAFIKGVSKEGGIDVFDLDKIEPKIKKAKELKEKVEKELKLSPALQHFNTPDQKLPDAKTGKVELFNNSIYRDFFYQQKAFAEQLEETKQRGLALADTITGVVTPAFQGMFDSLFEGGNVIQGFFRGIGSGLKSLLSRMAAALAQALALRAVFSLIPGVGQATGMGGLSFGKLFGKLMGFADGGVVFGPTAALIGEGRGTSRSNPEIVAPLDKLKNFIQGAGGGVQNLNGEFIIRGKDLVYILNQQNLSRGRSF